MNGLFAIMILFLLLMGGYGYAKGLIRMCFSFVALLISVLAMLLVAPLLSEGLQRNEALMDRIRTPLVQELEDRLEGAADSLDVEGVLSEYYHLPSSVSSTIVRALDQGVEKTAGNAASYVATTISIYVCDVAAYLIVFVTVRLLLLVVGQLLHVVERLPGIRSMNRLGGMALALGQGMIIILVFLFAVNLFQGQEFGRNVMEMIRSNDVLLGLYEWNPLMRLGGRRI